MSYESACGTFFRGLVNMEKAGRIRLEKTDGNRGNEGRSARDRTPGWRYGLHSIPDAADERKNNFVKFFRKMGVGALCEKSDVSASSGGWKRGMPSEGTEKAARVSIRIVCA